MGNTMKKEGWSYSAGERGRNRVRAYEDAKTGILMLEFYEALPGQNQPKRQRSSLGHRDRARARQQADEAAAEIGKAEAHRSERMTLQRLFDTYGFEVTPTKSRRGQKHDQRASGLFLRCFGGSRDPSTLSLRDQEQFIRERSSGRLAPNGSKGREVGPRTVERDLRFLHAVLNWAVLAGDGRGGFLLSRNPLKGLPLPREKSPRRPQLTQDVYHALLGIAGEMDPRFKAALVVAHETGHRIGAIRLLRWSDLELEEQTVRWGRESDKVGMEHTTPLTSEAVEALQELQKAIPGIGEAWVFPSPEDPSRPCSRHLVRDWWPRAEKLAGLKHQRGMGWHCLRRKFATELKDVPLKDLCQLGGWKSPDTVLACYQQPDQGTMRQSLEARRPIQGPRSEPNRQYESTVRAHSS